jgi:hypothetical protein
MLTPERPRTAMAAADLDLAVASYAFDGQPLVNAFPRDAQRAGVHPRCPSAPRARSR